MHPVWFNLFGYPVHFYAVAMATAFVVGIWLAARYGERVGIDRDLMLDLTWWMLVAGLVGARIAFIAVNWDQYYYPCVDWEYFNAHVNPNPKKALDGPDCTRLLRFWQGGLVFYGGAIGSMLTMVWFMRREKLPVWPIADAIIPSLALGQFFGRLGCLAAGCCWGKPTEVAWGLVFPPRSMARHQHFEQGLLDPLIHASDAPATIASLPVHPTQLYDALGGLLLFAFLIWFRQRKRFHGHVFLAWLLIYPVMRASVEIFRGDAERGYVFRYVNEGFNAFLGLPKGSATFLSTSQFISVCVVAFTLWLWRRRSKQANEEASRSRPAPEASH